LLGDVNKLFVFKGLLTTPSNVLPLHLKHTFPLVISIFTEGKGDGIQSRLPFKIFVTLPKKSHDIGYQFLKNEATNQQILLSHVSSASKFISIQNKVLWE
jgi:hypothetical protein